MTLVAPRPFEGIPITGEATPPIEHELGSLTVFMQDLREWEAQLALPIGAPDAYSLEKLAAELKAAALATAIARTRHNPIAG